MQAPSSTSTSNNQSRVQSFKESKGSTFEYRASLPGGSKKVEQVVGSAAQSEDIGEISPDLSAIKPMSKRVEVLIDNSMQIQPFSINPKACPEEVWVKGPLKKIGEEKK